MSDRASRWVPRRDFLKQMVAAGIATTVPARLARAESENPAPAWPTDFPRQAADVVREVVAASHGNFDRVRELVDPRPALAKATWDWGYGDWESALGAAAHVGRADIARYLIEKGARPNVFSAAMLGQLDVVKAFVAADPRTPSIAGPHGIPLLAHARAGGEAAQPVLAYLESLGTPDPARLDPDAVENAAAAGTYVFGAGAADRFEVEERDGRLRIARAGHPARMLTRVAPGVYFPAGAPAVRIAFAIDGARASSLTVDDGPAIHVVAQRSGA